MSPRNLAEKKKVCANLREISRSFLRESSRLRIFVRGVNAKKEFFSWADLYVTVRLQLSDAGAEVVFGRKLDRPWLSPSGTAEGHFRIH